ncbi:hypothetical protein L9F63_012112, partial [Diploptera punctata]
PAERTLSLTRAPPMPRGGEGGRPDTANLTRNDPSQVKLIVTDYLKSTVFTGSTTTKRMRRRVSQWPLHLVTQGLLQGTISR